MTIVKLNLKKIEKWTLKEIDQRRKRNKAKRRRRKKFLNRIPLTNLYSVLMVNLMKFTVKQTKTNNSSIGANKVPKRNNHFLKNK